MSSPIVTPQGVRDGDLVTLEELCARRGPAVLAYCEHACAVGHARRAAAESLGRFRAAIMAAEQPAHIHADRLLLSAVRQASAKYAPPPPALSLMITGPSASRPDQEMCAAMAQLLVAHIEGNLGPEDRRSAASHLAGCDFCRSLEGRFRDAEEAYLNAPQGPLSETAAEAMMQALIEARPVPSAEQSTAVLGQGEPWLDQPRPVERFRREPTITAYRTSDPAPDRPPQAARATVVADRQAGDAAAKRHPLDDERAAPRGEGGHARRVVLRACVAAVAIIFAAIAALPGGGDRRTFLVAGHAALHVPSVNIALAVNVNGHRRQLRANAPVSSGRFTLLLRLPKGGVVAPGSRVTVSYPAEGTRVRGRDGAHRPSR